MENYVPDLPFSASDYHHVKEQTLTKTYSTCHFPQPKSKSHGRQISRFTVISNVADTEHSYDPFKASRPQHLNSMPPADHAKITILRNRSNTQESKEVSKEKSKPRQTSRTSTSVGSDRSRQRLAPPRPFASRSSLASSTRSKNSASYMRAPVGHKRGVSFSHIQRRSTSSQRKESVDAKPAVVGRHSNHTEVTDNGGDSLHRVERASTNYIRSKKTHAAVSQPLLSADRPGRGSQLWSEDVRQLSSSLAMDCDEAFNRTSVIPDVEVEADDSFPSLKATTIIRKLSPLTSHLPANDQKSRLASLNTRPLPPPPARTESIKVELLEARKHAELRKMSGGDESPGYLDRMVSHIDHLMQPSSPEHRTASAPVESRRNDSNRPLPSIYEAYKEEDSPRRPTDYDKYMETQYRGKDSRAASAPEPREAKRHRDNRFLRSESGIRGTIRVVDPTSPSPVKVPAPLTIRKKSSQGGPSTPRGTFSPEGARASSKGMAPRFELRQQYRVGSKADLGRINEDYSYGDQFGSDCNAGTVVKKKPAWFKRNSKSDESGFKMSIKAADTMPSQSSSNDTILRLYLVPATPPQPKKKFSLGRLFKKRSSNPGMSLGGKYIEFSFNALLTYPLAVDDFDDDESLPDSITDMQRHARRISDNDDPRIRQIVPQQNWLATLFKVKPASKSICFSVSNRRARQEVVTILKEWKRYGIRDIEVDKKRNIVFGRVAAKNCKLLAAAKPGRS